MTLSTYKVSAEPEIAIVMSSSDYKKNFIYNYEITSIEY